jgi:3-oxoacyl-[acyl-carrier-protein] synthase-3
MHLNVDRHGNTELASISITLDTARTSGALSTGDVVLMAGFGGGMNMGMSLSRWGGASKASERPDRGAVSQDAPSNRGPVPTWCDTAGWASGGS